MSFSTYMRARSKGGWPYLAVPVFLSRVFPHSSIYIRTGSGIEQPEDLKGRRIGIPNYHFTRGLCVRGMLQDEYGLRPEDCLWRIGGVDEPGGLQYLPMPAPKGVEAISIDPGKYLGAMPVEGEIDAIITYTDPRVFTEKHPNIARLFPDFRPAEQDYFAKTGIFPIMHVLGIRESLLEAHPWIANNIVAAFEEAKSLCMPSLVDLDALAVSLPWLVAEAEATMALMGEDFWPYGVEKNKKTIQAQIRWSHEQGISDRIFQIEDLFYPTKSC
jgi:4,5-dihydroxyphthalate decarboxylase